MRAVVVFESMYGNTREVAEAIGSGLGSPDDVLVVPVSGANPDLLEGIDLLVVGGPTHAHGMSRPATRLAAVDAVEAGEQARAWAWGAQLAHEVAVHLVR